VSQKIIEIDIEAEDVQLFDRLVAEYGEGDPSKFLAYAIRKLNADRIRTKMQVLQAEARQDMGGKVFASDETSKIIRAVTEQSED
jgi:predicted flavoprotein YhiN